jgi:hypothetical protein
MTVSGFDKLFSSASRFFLSCFSSKTRFFSLFLSSFSLSASRFFFSCFSS